MKRGALIVIEGLDRTGKSTQSHALVESLRKKQIKAEYANFPSRHTEIGKVINSYLTSQKDLPDKAIHLLFSANRWERVQEMLKTLEEGTSIIVDRYCYSGVAFSAAKGHPPSEHSPLVGVAKGFQGIDIDWCKAPDCGLPKPDKVFFLTMPLESIEQRNGFGKERYEVFEFQKKVSHIYHQLKEDHWALLDARRTIEEIQEEMLENTMKIIKEVGDKPIGKVWVK